MGEQDIAMARALLLVTLAAQFSFARSLATVPATIVDAPMLNTTTVTACGVRVNWAVPADNGGKPVLYYTVYATGGGVTYKKMAVVQGAATTSTFVTGLSFTTAYRFTVTATNEIGESAKSPASSSITTQHTRKYIFVSDFLNDRVLRFDFATKSFKDVFVQKGSGGLAGPWGHAFNKFDDPTQPRTMLVSSEKTKSLIQYDACDGTHIKKFAHVSGSPRGLKFHTLPSAHKPPRQQNMVLVASAYTDSIVKYNAMTGSPLGVFATGVDTPFDLVISPPELGEGGIRGVSDVFVSSEHGDAVYLFENTTGAFKAKFTDKKVNYANGLAIGTDDQTTHLYVTGPYAGKVIVKFDINNGSYIEHFEDRDMQYALGMFYMDRTIYLCDKHTIKTYDAETGEFLEVWASHPGMMCAYMVPHDM